MHVCIFAEMKLQRDFTWNESVSLESHKPYNKNSVREASFLIVVLEVLEILKIVTLPKEKSNHPSYPCVACIPKTMISMARYP